MTKLHMNETIQHHVQIYFLPLAVTGVLGVTVLTTAAGGTQLNLWAWCISRCWRLTCS